jgi:tetratricopeptide (TPR) repeat protein
LGLALAKLRKLTESYQHFEQALIIRKKALGEDHPDVAECYSLLAQVQLALGKANQALPLFQQALGIHEKTLGEAHPSVASDLTGLARVQLALGRPSLAVELLDRSLKIRELKKSPPGEMIETQRILAEARLRMEKYSHRKEIK